MVMLMSKKQKTILIFSIVVILCLISLCIIFYDEVIKMLDTLLNKTDELKDLIEGLGIIGVLVIGICILLLFFFPVVTSVPLQICLGLTYGILNAAFIIWISLTIAHQMLFLFSRSMKIFYSKKRLEEQKRLEDMIKNSKRGINTIMLLAYVVPFIPFLIISMVAISSGMKYRRYFLYTTLGPIPEIFVTLYLGEKLVATSPLASMIFVILLLIIVVLCFIFKSKIIDLIFNGNKKKKEIE